MTLLTLKARVDALAAQYPDGGEGVEILLAPVPLLAKKVSLLAIDKMAQAVTLNDFEQVGMLKHDPALA